MAKKKQKGEIEIVASNTLEFKVANEMAKMFFKLSKIDKPNDTDIYDAYASTILSKMDEWKSEDDYKEEDLTNAMARMGFILDDAFNAHLQPSETPIDYVIRSIYADRILSPFIQLAIIEQAAEDTGKPYNSYSRQMRKATKGMNRCIACLKKCDKPCHTINMDTLTYIRKANRKAKGGTGKGSTYENKKNPKGKATSALLTAMSELDLDFRQHKSINDNFKELRPEILTLFTGMVANTFEKLELTTTEDLITRGLVELLPDREKDFIKTGKPPKYGSKIDIKDYMTFWNSANQIGSLTEAFKDIRTNYGEIGRVLADHNPNKETKSTIPFNTVGVIPYPCEKDMDWHIHVKEGPLHSRDESMRRDRERYLGRQQLHFDGYVNQVDYTYDKRMGISMDEIRNKIDESRYSHKKGRMQEMLDQKYREEWNDKKEDKKKQLLEELMAKIKDATGY